MRSGRSSDSDTAPASLIIDPTRRGAADWSRAADGAHIVQFYRNVAMLVDRASRYIGTALVGGGSSIVVATNAHRAAIARRLKARGFDIEVPRRQGRYVQLDAAETLRKVLVDGWPDEAAFADVVGQSLRAAAVTAEGRRPVAAVGEIVAQLCGRRRIEAAIRLEQLWNELARTQFFSLCCAYPMSSFEGEHDTAPFLKICAQHSHVFPAEHLA